MTETRYPVSLRQSWAIHFELKVQCYICYSIACIFHKQVELCLIRDLVRPTGCAIHVTSRPGFHRAHSAVDPNFHGEWRWYTMDSVPDCRDGPSNSILAPAVLMMPLPVPWWAVGISGRRWVMCDNDKDSWKGRLLAPLATCMANPSQYVFWECSIPNPVFNLLNRPLDWVARHGLIPDFCWLHYQG